MSNQLVKPSEEKAISFVPFGSQDAIKLSVSIIKTMVCTPTKSGKVCDDRQAIKFMMLCQAQHLNPFAGDCYLIGYDGRNGPEFSIITAHQAFLKRAEVSKEFDGMESGVIVRHKENGELKEFEGDFFDAFYELTGGWARVHHKGRKVATLRKCALKTYIKAYGLWADPNQRAMMIVKVAESDALRSTFPTMLGGLYTPGESVTIEAEPVDVRTSRLVATAPEAVEDRKGEPESEPEPSRQPENGQRDAGPFDWVTAPGHTFDQFAGVIKEQYPAMPADSWGGFGDIKPEHARVLQRAKAGILAELDKESQRGRE